MRKFINTVTITGIDVYSSLDRLSRLQRDYPFVEWGVLLSKTKSGVDNRYPPTSWVTDLIATDLRLSGHICGHWARDIADGGTLFVDERRELGWLELFKRFQLNVSHVLADIHRPYRNFYAAIEKLQSRVIIQVRSLNHAVIDPLVNQVDFLFDCSGGRGLLPDHWPTPIYKSDHAQQLFLLNCGYAGGLNPDNLGEQLPLMEEAADDQNIWIDVESGVRTTEVLDMDKVERFLDIAAPWVINARSTVTPDPACGPTPSATA